jgi:hypothetical protein
MANSVVDIYNLALSAIGTRSDVAAVDEGSPEANACNLWYEVTLNALLRAAPWSFATAYERLALLSTRDWTLDWGTADPPPAWGYEFAAPSTMVRPRYLTTFERFDLSMRGTTHSIVTNSVEPILCFTKRQPLVSMWDDQFVSAMANGLGAAIAMKVSGKVNRARSALQIANDLIEQARLSDANQSSPQTYDAMPSWFAIRGASGDALAPGTYIYPYGPILSIPSLGT